MDGDSLTEVPLNSNHNSIVEIKSSKENLAKLPPGVGRWCSTRFFLAYLGFFGFFNVYALRVNLSVAILSMVNSSYLTSNVHNSSDACPGPVNQTTNMSGEFNWDGNTRGLVLGAFFYGYILTQLPGGYLAGRFGGKILFGAGVFCTSALTLLTPIAARTSFPLLIALRIAEGIGEGVTFPAMHSMWGVWAPPVERSRLVSITYAGCHLGTVFAQPVSGILCSSDFLGGWPSVFYVFGALGIAWCCLWFLFAYNTPEEHPRISPEELNYICSNVEPRASSSDVPWYDIATSKHVWAISIAHFTNNWGFYTLLTSLPLYLSEVLRFNLLNDAFIAALPYLVMWISINFSGMLADYLRESGTLTTTQVRKSANTIASVGPAIFLIAAGYVGCNKTAAVAMICLSMLFCGFQFSGFNSNHIDIASRYAGILMGISNTWATIPGFVGPIVVGALTGDKGSHQEWLYVFYISAAIYVVGALLFLLLGTGVEQEWNKVSYRRKPVEERKALLHDGFDHDHDDRLVD